VTGDPDAVTLKAAGSKQQGDQAESTKKGEEKEVPVQQMAQTLFDRYDEIIKENTLDGIPPAIVSGGYEFRMTGLGGKTEDALRGAANKLDMAVRQAMAKINPSTVYFPEPNTIFRMLKPGDNRVVAGTFTSDSGKSEGNALVAKIRKQKQLERKDMVFDLRAAMETNSDRFNTTIDNQEVNLKIDWTGGEIPKLTEQYIKAIFESSQTHAKRFYWVRRVEAAYRYGRKSTTERTNAIGDVYDHFLPNALIGYNPEDLKNNLKNYTDLENYGEKGLENNTEIKKALTDAKCPFEYEEVINLAKEAGKAAQKLLMEILGIE
jgi:hypothetical protein